MRRRHANTPGLPDHYQVLGLSSLKGTLRNLQVCNSILSVVCGAAGYDGRGGVRHAVCAAYDGGGGGTPAGSGAPPFPAAHPHA